MVRLLVALVLSSGCYVSPYAQSGDTALAEGDYARAVADYYWAYNDARDGSAEEEACRFEFEAAVHAWVLTEVGVAERLAVEGEVDVALERIWGLVETPWLPETARVETLSAAAALVEAAWPDAVLAHVERGHFFAAVQTARRLVVRFPADHPIRVRLREVEERAATAHAALASESGNRAFARRLHRCLGDYFAGKSSCESEPPPSYRPVAWQIAPVAGDCAWVGEQLVERLRSPAPNPMPVTLTVTGCQKTEKRWTTEESYTYVDRVPFIAEIDEPTLETADCPEPECERRDTLGTCVAWQQREPCAGEPVWTTRRKKVRRYQEVAREGTRTIHHVDFSASARGSARFVWEGETITLPISAEVRFSDQAFWSPQEQERFGGAGLQDAKRQVLDKMARVFGKFRGRRVRRHGLGLIERAQAAAADGNYAAAEELYVESVRALDEALSPAARYFATRYGFSPELVRTLVNGGVPPHPDPQTYVAPMAAVSDEAGERSREISRVRAKSGRGGAGRLFAVSVDLAGSFEMSPLDDTDFATGVVATLRGGEGNVWFRWRLDTPNLGGDARGFGVEIVGGEKIGNGLAATSGLSYREQRNDRGQRYAQASLPLNLYWVPLSWLILDAEVRLNLLKIRDWTTGKPGDPGYGSPLSLGLTLQSTHLFLQARGTTWLGMETEQVFYAGGLVGVRL